MDHHNTYYTENKNKYSKEANHQDRSTRRKRASERLYFPNNKSVCNLYLKVDPILYKEIYQREGSEVSFMYKFLKEIIF